MYFLHFDDLGPCVYIGLKKRGQTPMLICHTMKEPLCINLNKKIVFNILINHYEFTCCIENSVDPDQVASESTLFTRELISAWFHTVLESENCLSKERYQLICTIEQVNFSLDKYIMAIYLSLDK